MIDKENIFHCMGLLYLTVAYLPEQEVSNSEKMKWQRVLLDGLDHLIGMLIRKE